MPRGTASRFSVVAVALLAVSALAFYLSLTNGTFDISVAEVFKTLLRIDANPDFELVVFEFRLPRIVLGALVGFALGIAGSVIQGVTRNALADPGILGINAGAGMAVVLYMLVFQGSTDMTDWLGIYAMPLFGLAGGLTATALIYMLARSEGRIDPQRLILVGIALASGFGAVSTFLSLKMNANDYEMAAVWLAGSIYSANWPFVKMVLPWLLVFVPLLWWRARVLDLFQLEESSTRGLGVRIERERNWLLLGSIGLVSASVAVSGSIAFVGLIAPHMARRMVGLQHRLSLPASGLAGMAMVLVGDFIGKTVFAPAQLAVGIVISIIGVPYFVYLLFKTTR
ncbi:FecCD family ABC transporter permease [Cohnella fermenti]|uniref:Iron ABC transporter permease n=1 Tax=Cohnella fermenti TaxID=2565925 RepID=A0A4S4CEW3_9BACL|nr:iron ABC transporter permease [Cohnella fermenti]THF84545.1 iron ABC transporter permease [Cohnella fermenti]